MSFAICRTEKIKTWGSLSKSVGHNMRTTNEDRQHLNPNAPEPLRIMVGEADWVDHWQEQVNSMHLRKLQQGQTHTLAREFFLGMSPEWMEGKTQKDVDEWATANVEWLKERFGAHRVKFAVLHLDEQTPHLAAYVVALKEDKKPGRGNGWTLSDRELQLGGNKEALSKLQDEYAEAMKSFELRRGIRGSKAKHQTTAQWKGQMAHPLEKPIVKPKVPDPTVADRFDPKAYAKQAADAAAKAVFDQMKPHHQQAKAQAKQLREQSKEMHKLRGIVEQLQPLADMLKAILEALLGRPMNLDTLQGQKEAQTVVKSLLETSKRKRQEELAATPPAKATNPIEPPPVAKRPRQSQGRDRGPSLSR